jgi:hypothetical protein
MWKKIVDFFKNLFKKGKDLLYVIYVDSKKDIQKFLNDPELQKLALEAIKTAALAKLGGNVAWEAAFAAFSAAVKAKGFDLGTALLETILQNTYIYFKFNLKDDLLKKLED